MNSPGKGRSQWDHFRQHGWLLLSLLAGIAATGCKPEIGDKCSISTDCSVQGDRLCDVTQPAGYCTVFNCEPNRCPDDSVCVAFSEPSCASPALSARFQRTFCMKVCESGGDCRAEYACLDVSNDPARRVVDVNPSSRRICAVAPRGPSTPLTTEPEVCRPLPLGDGGADASQGQSEAAAEASEAAGESSSSIEASSSTDDGAATETGSSVEASSSIEAGD